MKTAFWTIQIQFNLTLYYLSIFHKETIKHFLNESQRTFIDFKHLLLLL